MEVHLKPEMESRLNELAFKSGRPTDDLVAGGAYIAFHVCATVLARTHGILAIAWTAGMAR